MKKCSFCANRHKRQRLIRSERMSRRFLYSFSEASAASSLFSCSVSAAIPAPCFLKAGSVKSDQSSISTAGMNASGNSHRTLKRAISAVISTSTTVDGRCPAANFSAVLFRAPKLIAQRERIGNTQHAAPRGRISAT